VYAHYPSRAEAKVALLKMVNKHSISEGTPAPLKALEDELADIRLQIIGLPQYAGLRATSDDTKGNLIGSWVNAAICRHENQMLMAVVDHLKAEEHSVALLMYDGVMLYGDHYDAEKELCARLQKELLDRFGIAMPFTMKPHSTVFRDKLEPESKEAKTGRREKWTRA
jgi:hypothetical protein